MIMNMSPPGVPQVAAAAVEAAEAAEATEAAEAAEAAAAAAEAAEAVEAGLPIQIFRSGPLKYVYFLDFILCQFIFILYRRNNCFSSFNIQL